MCPFLFSEEGFLAGVISNNVSMCGQNQVSCFIVCHFSYDASLMGVQFLQDTVASGLADSPASGHTTFSYGGSNKMAHPLKKGMVLNIFFNHNTFL